MDAVQRPMIDGTERQAALELTLGELHALQRLVSEGQIRRAQRVVVAVHDEPAIQRCERIDVGLIDAWVAVLGEAHVCA